MANSMAKLRIILLIIACFLLASPTSCRCSRRFNNVTDLLSLLAFKSAIDLDPLGALHSWNETLNLCSWEGIRCSRRHRDRVVSIDLSSQGLVGSLSPHVGNLSFIRSINLHNNTFRGPIPREIGLLRRLEFIELSNNSFLGPVPTNLSRCPKLVYLNLIDNDLSGQIPEDLGSSSTLEALGLAKNKLSGPIPPSIGNITSLTLLSLAYCNLNGEIPESLAQLRNLRSLLLNLNNLTGTIPPALFNISALQIFEVNVNQLHGAIPSTIGLMLPNLKRLYLGGNQFSGAIPASISNASLLQRLQLYENSFTGPMPRVGRLTHLEDFIFGSNLIADDANFISSLTNSSQLTHLEVDDNLLSGSLPESISNLSTHLTRLDLNKNMLHGSIPSGIGNLISLTSIDISRNYLEGSIPMGVAKASHLHELYVGMNRFTDQVPSSLGNLTVLNRLYLNGNYFMGNLPPSIGNCTDLLELDLSHNNFTGLIPQEIMSLSSVSIVFDLSYNALKGPIPYEVGSLTNLVALDLSNNRLSGAIPNSLSHCTSLQQMYLQGNSLEGEIPSQLISLMGLQDLDLSQNNLSGPIPRFLERLNLEKLNLSFNELQGEVPTRGVFKNKTSVSLDGNKQLCGGIWELRLPPCSLQKSHMPITLLKILIPILVVGGGTGLALLAFCNYKKRMSRKSAAVPSFASLQFPRLTYADLNKATGHFSDANLLGVGRFGSVYKGALDDGDTLVAVKVLNLFVRGASKSFMAECDALRNARHRNLLKILSVCDSIDFQGNNFKALVYEYKANGSLEKFLYQDAETSSLNAIQRLNIAIDVAQAIEYLHFGTDSSIVHGDLKPSNILLDHEMTAHVGDFGLAKILVPSHGSSSSTGIRGTIGYVAPEYATNNMVSIRGDVYSYGILLLEMFTNRRPTDHEAFTDHANLHDFVSNAFPDQLEEVVDPRIVIAIGHDKKSKVRDCMASVLRIGIACSRTTPHDRMSITDVVRDLCKIRDHYLS